MTKIYVHGILGKIFGKFFQFKINNCYNAIKAIDANKSGFYKKMIDLSNLNQNYYILIDGQMIQSKDELLEKRQINKLDFVPAILGFGQVIAPLLVSGAAAQAAVAFAINTVISAGISFGISLIANALNKQGAPPQQNIAVGGAVMTAEAKGKSFIFTNWSNLVAQGTAVPVGYGKARIASRVIYATTKNYPTSQTFTSASNLNNLNIINY